MFLWLRLWWYGRKRLAKILRLVALIIYETLMIALLGASLGWGLDDVGAESIVIALLLFLPVVLPQVQSLTLPLLGGQTTVHFRQIQDQITSQRTELAAVSNKLDLVVNAVSSSVINLFERKSVQDGYVRRRVAIDRTITIACQPQVEQRLLCAILEKLLREKTDLKPDVKWDLGAAALTYIALVRGQVDILPTHTWTGFEMGLGPLLSHPHRRLLRLSAEKAIEEL